MAGLGTLRRRRAAAKLGLEAAERRHRGGVADARKLFEKATQELLRAELNRRIAAPLLRAQAAREQTADLFSIGV
ncbi:MAG: hypothetical protein DI537_08565 [Stutzerimonas stutzeri]|nr:MAG: hypothetical protein DI537_08565 [Stutzerimonas stutzeri]